MSSIYFILPFILCQYLLTIFTATPRKTVDWGFAIDESPTPAKEVTTKIKLGDQATLKGVVIGGTLKNIGTTDLHIYKGSTTKGDPIIVLAGESVGIAKGYSVITVSNPNSLQEKYCPHHPTLEQVGGHKREYISE